MLLAQSQELNYVVARGGLEPPTRRFSISCSTPELPGLNPTNFDNIARRGVVHYQASFALS